MNGDEEVKIFKGRTVMIHAISTADSGVFALKISSKLLTFDCRIFSHEMRQCSDHLYGISSVLHIRCMIYDGHWKGRANFSTVNGFHCLESLRRCACSRKDKRCKPCVVG